MEKNSSHRSKAYLTTVLSLLAFGISALTLYFNFLYRVNDLQLAPLDYKIICCTNSGGDSRILSVAVVNSGNRDGIIFSVELVYWNSIVKMWIGHRTVPIEDLPIFLKPEQIKVISIPVAQYLEQSSKDWAASAKAPSSGLVTVPIGLVTSTMDSSGHRHLRHFQVGRAFFDREGRIDQYKSEKRELVSLETAWNATHLFDKPEALLPNAQFRELPIPSK